MKIEVSLTVSAVQELGVVTLTPATVATHTHDLLATLYYTPAYLYTYIYIVNTVRFSHCSFQVLALPHVIV